MTDGEQEKSGELTSFLHLTGWRPVVLALIAGTAAAVGLYLALGEPAKFVTRFVVSVKDVADDDLTPAEISNFSERIVIDMKLPQTITEVERVTGLVEEDDYEIGIQRSPSSSEIIDINVVADTADNAEDVAVETAIAGLNRTLSGERGVLSRDIDAQLGALRTEEEREDQLIDEAGGINPTTAYIRAQDRLLDRQAFFANRPTVVLPDDDGNLVTQPAPEPEGPTLEQLQAEVERLEPISREYDQVRARIDDLNLRLADDRDSLREFDTAIADLETEREEPSVIQKVDTEEASRISALLTGLLLFAIPAALVTIVLFVIFDLLFRRTDDSYISAQPLDAHGVLDPVSHPALPEASVAQLVVVDDQGNESTPIAAELNDGVGGIYDGVGGIYDADNDFDAHDDSGGGRPDDGGSPDGSGGSKSTSKSKDSRWGRDAGSKAG